MSGDFQNTLEVRLLYFNYRNVAGILNSAEYETRTGRKEPIGDIRLEKS